MLSQRAKATRAAPPYRDEFVKIYKPYLLPVLKADAILLQLACICKQNCNIVVNYIVLSLKRQ